MYIYIVFFLPQKNHNSLFHIPIRMKQTVVFIFCWLANYDYIKYYIPHCV